MTSGCLVPHLFMFRTRSAAAGSFILARKSPKVRPTARAGSVPLSIAAADGLLPEAINRCLNTGERASGPFGARNRAGRAQLPPLSSRQRSWSVM